MEYDSLDIYYLELSPERLSSSRLKSITSYTQERCPTIDLLLSILLCIGRDLCKRVRIRAVPRISS